VPKQPKADSKSKPNPVGRPKLHDQAKSSIVPVRFSAEDRKRVENAAASKGTTVSDWIRNTLNAALEM
jgi:predicted HicB family RNase H-like nuclease